MPSMLFFLFNYTATTEIYTLSLHDALPICRFFAADVGLGAGVHVDLDAVAVTERALADRSEEHTSELQSHVNLVCRLLLEKKNNKYLVSQLYSMIAVHNHLAVGFVGGDVVL